MVLFRMVFFDIIKETETHKIKRCFNSNGNGSNAD